MKTVASIIQELMRVEGGYSNDPADPGGKTMFGVTEAVARSFGYTGPMNEMPPHIAYAIYYDRYLTKTNFSKVMDVYVEVGVELFDTGVNMGVEVAAKFLQEALNAFNNVQAVYPDVVVDGQIGEKTLQALNKFKNFRGEEGQVVLLRALNSLQGARYIDICQGREKSERYVYGWFLNRVVI